jgi:hypothetical protein
MRYCPDDTNFIPASSRGANADCILGGVLYDVEEADRIVNVLVGGEKRGNPFFVQERKFRAHESDRPSGSESEP